MFRAIIFLTIVLFAETGCREKYNPDIDYPNTGYLVVEGFINSGSGATNIRLSRTLKISEIGTKYESGAQVAVEGDDNTRYILSAQANGLYSNSQLALNKSRKFRLRIKTSNGKEYLSDYAPVITTPPIDSLSWTREGPNLQFYVNTHDPQNKTWYYTWSYEETWELRARYQPSLKYVTDASGRITGVTLIYPSGAVDTTGYRCWQYENSTNILIGSSIKLSQDVIRLPLYSIPWGSWKMGYLYSVKVNQHGVSQSGYDFLQRMKKNTQGVGSIFDAQPSELNGNIHNISNPAENVIGFVDVSDSREQRVFINPLWNYSLDCEEMNVPLHPDSLRQYSYLSPIEYAMSNGQTLLFAASAVCVDCRLRGINQKPSYWPR